MHKPTSIRNGAGKHVLVYNQTTIEDSSQPQGCIGVRHMVTFMLFLGMANAYIMRTNMSVAIVAMVNHTALEKDPTLPDNECVTRSIVTTSLVNQSGYGNESWVKEIIASAQMGDSKYQESQERDTNGSYEWSTVTQGHILSSFFYGYVLTQIPFGILSKRYGSKYFLGIGMLINSVFGLLVPVAAEAGYGWLMAVRFIQGLGEGPIVPCSHAMLAKWIPPNERSRMGAFVYAGAQFGTVVSMPLSGLLAQYGFAGGWPSIFYVFGLVGIVWSVAFLIIVYESPDVHPKIPADERKYILESLWGSAGISSPPIPWRSIATSLPFWAILFAHMGQNFGYETLMTELPTFMKQVLHFDIKVNGFLSALPYLAMWLFSIMASHIADWMISSQRFNHTQTRKILNAIGEYGPALALIGASYTGCDPVLTVALLTIGIGLNGGIYSGFKVNHLDISPRFAGILMSFTNCLANLAGLLAPLTAGKIIDKRPTQAAWREVFMISSGVYIVCSTIYLIFGSGERQAWDNPSNDAPTTNGVGNQGSDVEKTSGMTLEPRTLNANQ